MTTSPTDTLVSSAGSKWKPPAPALTLWYRTSVALVCVVTDEVAEMMLVVVAVDVVEDVALVLLSVVICTGPCAKAVTTIRVSVAVQPIIVNIIVWVVIFRGAIRVDTLEFWRRTETNNDYTLLMNTWAWNVLNMPSNYRRSFTRSFEFM